MSIQTAIIACGGNGTRMYPITKSIPKEMLPIGTIPVIDYILFDCYSAGIENIVFVINQNKTQLIDYIYKTKEEDFKKNMRFSFIPQIKNYGTACLLQSVRHVVDDEFFALLFPDEVFLSKETSMQQLLAAYERTQEQTVGVFCTDRYSFRDYGIVDYNKNTNLLTDIIEKPTENPPSLYAVCGRFIFSESIYRYLDALYPTNGEFYLTDAIRIACKAETYSVQPLSGKRYDCGSRENYLRFIHEIHSSGIDIFQNRNTK